MLGDPMWTLGLGALLKSDPFKVSKGS